MKQAVNGQVAGSNRVGNRVDEERHVVVDDRHPHPPPPRLAAGRFNLDRQVAGEANRGHIGDKARRLNLVGQFEALKFVGKRIGEKRLLQPVDRCRPQARDGRHGF